MPDPGLEARRSASTRGRQRAVELADGFIFGGAARPSTIAPAIQSMRPRTTEAGKTDSSFNAVAYIAHGPIEHIKEVLAEYAACGLCLLVLLPEVRSLRQLDLLAEQVLPSPSTGPDAYPARREAHGRLPSLRALLGRSWSAAQAACHPQCG
jgi:hypothetical protein